MGLNLVSTYQHLNGKQELCLLNKEKIIDKNHEHAPLNPYMNDELSIELIFIFSTNETNFYFHKAEIKKIKPIYMLLRACTTEEICLMFSIIVLYDTYMPIRITLSLPFFLKANIKLFAYEYKIHINNPSYS